MQVMQLFEKVPVMRFCCLVFSFILSSQFNDFHRFQSAKTPGVLGLCPELHKHQTTCVWVIAEGGIDWARVAAVFQGQDEHSMCGWLVAVIRSLLICTFVFLRAPMWNPISDVTSTQAVLRLLGRRSSAFFGTCDQLLPWLCGTDHGQCMWPCSGPRQTGVCSPACSPVCIFTFQCLQKVNKYSVLQS